MSFADAEASKIRLGFVCGKEDGDLVLAPGIPEEYWCWSTLSEMHEDLDPPIKLKEVVHTDIAIWWYIHEHYRPSIIADLIIGPDEVSAERLKKNNMNMLLGWDAVSAHLEERAEQSDFTQGHARKKSALLYSAKNHIWPPFSLQEMCNNKGNYLRFAQENKIPLAPTLIHDLKKASPQEDMSANTLCTDDDSILKPPKKRPKTKSAGHIFADTIAQHARASKWSKLVVKPSPSSWCRGVETLETDDNSLEKSLSDYFQSVQGADHIIAQRHLDGLEQYPETRCFFFGRKFLYAVANATFTAGGDLESVTDHPEAASDAPEFSPRHLPPRFWKRHVRLAERVLDILPPLSSPVHNTPLTTLPCIFRFDIGLHRASDLINASSPSPPLPSAITNRAKPTDDNDDDDDLAVFLNEIEIVPTLYLDPKFGHDRNFIAEYADGLVAAATEYLALQSPNVTLAKTKLESATS